MRLRLNISNNLQLFVEKLIVPNLSGPHEHRMVELKENYVHVIYVPTKRNLRVV